MNIKVTLTDEPNFSYHTGGGCAETDCFVNIDSRIDTKLQVETVIHEILEAHLWFIVHDKIEELTEAIISGLEQLKS